jgi:hypothetical protein
LVSPAFADGEPIPPLYTCDGANLSPELHWTGVPAGAVTLSLTCEDPDAPRGTFTHWVLWNLNPDRGQILSGEVPTEARQGLNGFGHLGYDGPCPPRFRSRQDTLLDGLKRPWQSEIPQSRTGGNRQEALLPSVLVTAHVRQMSSTSSPDRTRAPGSALEGSRNSRPGVPPSTEDPCRVSDRGVRPVRGKHVTDYVRRRGPFESHRPELDEIAPTTMPVVADWLADRRQPWSSPAVCQRQKPSRMLHDHLPVSALEASSSWQRKTEAQPGPTC